MQKKLGICLALLLSGCSTDTVPDEEFEGPTLNFPLLGNVPDRPNLPEPEGITHHENNLRKERDQALQKQEGIIRSIKS